MKDLAIGISGINAVDNPGPGVGVARSLKEAADLRARIIGLAMFQRGEYHPFDLDTFGLGAALVAAAKKGARRCFVGIGEGAYGPVASAMTTRFPETLRRLIPAGRMGANTDVAAAVAFLASERSAFITGEILDVNGGMWCD